jgi:cytochrome c oxidase subunit 1
MANAVTAIVFLLIGAVMAILIALTRWQAVHLLNQALFYRFLTAHGLNMLIFWIIFFEIAGLYFGATILLNARLAKPKVAWACFALMLLGAILADIMVFAGKADVMFTSYPPLQAHPLYYLGIVLFAVGALLACFLFLATLVLAKQEGKYQNALPLVTFGLAVASIIAIWTLAHGALTYVPTLLWSIGIIKNIDAEMYRLTYWGLGHGAQQINLAAMVSIWYLLGTLTVGSKPPSQKLSRIAFFLYLPFINLGSIHHLLVDPGLSAPYRVFVTSYAMYLAVLGSLIHAFSIPAGVEIAQRAKGFTKGLFQWLRKAPWGTPGFSAMALSFVIFGFIGGTTGVIQGSEQINMLAHNTLRIPGHFHTTVVAGTTLAFMGIAYYVIPLVGQRKIIWEKVAKFQPYIFGIGVVIMAVGMLQAGSMGVPRRHWDVTFADANLPVSLGEKIYGALGLLGIGGIIAFIGALIFILIAVGSLLKGESLKEA